MREMERKREKESGTKRGVGGGRQKDRESEIDRYTHK